MDDRWYCYHLNKTIEAIAQRFAEKYFLAEDPEIKLDIHFVEDSFSDELNYNVFINDYYFSLQDIYHALWYDIPFDIIDEWYEEWTTNVWDTILQAKVSLKNFYLLKKEEWKKPENIDHINGK